MSAECRVEALSSSGADISVEGLRLRLELRIVPRTAADGAVGGEMFRVVTAKIGTGAAPVYQWAAVVLGLGALLTAVVLGLAAPKSAAPPATPEAQSSPARASQAETRERSGAPSAPSVAPRDEQPAISSTGSPPSTPSAAATAQTPPPASPSAGATPGAAPRDRRQAPPSAPKRVAEVETKLTSPSAPQRREPAPSAAAASTAASAAAPIAPSRGASRDDMLDLFGDPK